MIAVITAAAAVAAVIVAIAVPAIGWWYRQPVNLAGQRRVRPRWIGRAR